MRDVQNFSRLDKDYIVSYLRVQTYNLQKLSETLECHDDIYLSDAIYEVERKLNRLRKYLNKRIWEEK